MSNLETQEFISFLVYSGIHVVVSYTYYVSKRKIYFNNDVYYYKMYIMSKLG